jgi:hypothetical protein
MPEELFFLFIASCISLWLIQLVSESIERRRIQRGTAREQYRGHLILVRAHQKPDTDDWSATAHIQFNQDNLTFRDVQLPGPTSYFPTKTSAENQALKEAKLWIDERLGKAKTFAH